MNMSGLQFPGTFPAVGPFTGKFPSTAEMLHSTEAQQTEFQQMLTQAISATWNQEAMAEQKIQMAITGADITQAEVFSAIRQADLALKTMMQVRNKLVSAFQEIKNMQI